jgi:hypothetical protein
VSVLSCAWCGKDLPAKRADAKFCGQPCKQAYWRWKHKLDMLRAGTMGNINEIFTYIAHENTRSEAEQLLKDIADKLWLLGVIPQPTQIPFPEEAYQLSNQLGGQNE